MIKSKHENIAAKFRANGEKSKLLARRKNSIYLAEYTSVTGWHSSLVRIMGRFNNTSLFVALDGQVSRGMVVITLTPTYMYSLEQRFSGIEATRCSTPAHDTLHNRYFHVFRLQTSAAIIAAISSFRSVL